MIRIGLILTLVFTSIFARTQTPIEVSVFGGPWDDVGRKILEDTDGGYTVFGTTGSAQNAGSQFYLLKLDSNLVYQWSQVYGGGNVDVGISMTQNSNGEHFLFGHSNSFGSDGYHLVIYQVDAFGAVINQWVYDHDVWEFAADMKTHPNGSLVVAYNTYGGSMGNQDMAVAMIDSQGVVQWEQFFGSPDFDEVAEVEIADNGNIIVVGTETTEGGPRGWVGVIDESGLLLNETLYGNSETHIHGALALADGIVFVGGYVAVPGDGLDYFLAKVDYNLVLQWEELVNAVGEEVNNDVIAIGNALMTCGKSNAYGWGGWGGLLHFRTGTGIFLNSVVAGGFGDDEILDLIRDSSGRLVMVGKSDSYTDFYDPDLMVLRFQDEFFGNPLEENVEVYVDTFLGEQELQDQVPNFYIADGQLHWDEQESEYQQILVHDALGRLLFDAKTGSGRNVVFDLPNGIVVVTLKGSGKSSSKKILMVR